MGITRRSASSRERVNGYDRFQHWYRDNQVYFITARCYEKFPAFEDEEAKTIFWRQFEKYADQHRFEPWVTSLLNNHYHTIGYLHCGAGLAPMMRGINGSVAKLVNDHLERSLSLRRTPFWHDGGNHNRNYFDGCLRDERQGRLTYRYVLGQSVRHGICADWRDYPHTRITVELEHAIRDALNRRAFLEGVPYKRYQRRR